MGKGTLFIIFKPRRFVTYQRKKKKKRRIKKKGRKKVRSDKFKGIPSEAL